MLDKKSLYRAKQLTESLLQGVDPFTGQDLPPGTVLHHADMLRALLTCALLLKQEISRIDRREKLPGKVGGRWTPEEEALLVSEFKGGEPLPEIAARHGRTIRAIEARLVQLGLLSIEQLSRGALGHLVLSNGSPRRDRADEHPRKSRARGPQSRRSPKRSV
jgi:hypothetical protein